MAVSSIPTSNPTGAAAATTGKGMSGLSGEDFMNLLIKQLQLQDPFQPMTNEQMVSQMSTIRELEMNTRLSNRLEQLTDHQRFGSAAALIGKQVAGVVSDTEGNEYILEGLVTAVRFTEKGEVVLELDSGDVLPLSKVQQVTDPNGAGTSATEG